MDGGSADNVGANVFPSIHGHSQQHHPWFLAAYCPSMDIKKATGLAVAFCNNLFGISFYDK
jgi:hypothetical protein